MCDINGVYIIIFGVNFCVFFCVFLFICTSYSSKLLNRNMLISLLKRVKSLLQNTYRGQLIIVVLAGRLFNLKLKEGKFFVVVVVVRFTIMNADSNAQWEQTFTLGFLFVLVFYMLNR